MNGTVESLLREQLAERRERLESAATTVPGDEQVQRLLREVDAALERMERGTFGVCVSCHESVEPERLVADPLIEYCIDHLTPTEQRRLEQDLDLAARVLRGLLPPASRSSPVPMVTCSGVGKTGGNSLAGMSVASASSTNCASGVTTCCERSNGAAT